MATWRRWVRQLWGTPRALFWLDDFTHDVRHAIRSLRRTPVFTAVALLTLALGIGANTAIFSILSGVMLRPLAYRNPGQLMHVTADFSALGVAGNAVSVPEYLEFRQMNRSFAALGAYTTGADIYTTGEVNLLAGDRPLRVRSISVDNHLLDALGIRPAQGRFFSEAEISFETRGLAAPVAILSHELWQNAFAAQPLVGKTLNIDGRPHEILGVMPPGADLMDHRTEVWLPLGFHREIGRSRSAHVLYMIGRLKDGITPQDAETELNAFLEDWAGRTGVAGHVPTARPARPVDHALRIQPLQQAIVSDAGRSIWMLQVAVGFVLLIACANLANLLLARAESRRREFALRAALGASQSRLRRQTLAEGLLLSVAGGTLGLWFAQSALQALILAYPTIVPRMSEIVVDLRVLLFALGVSTLTGVLFGLAPVSHRRIGDLLTALKESGDRGATGGRHRLRGALVVAEVAMAVMLVVGAGLLIQTVYNLASVDTGFNRSRLVTFSITLAEPYDPDTRAPAYQRLIEKLRAVPGVQSAAIMSGLPPERPPASAITAIENYTNADGRPIEVIDYYQAVIGDYFETMGIPIVAGRGFEPADAAPAAGRVVVVNETLASRIWKGENPIGRRLRPNFGVLGFANGPMHTVIGVARDVKQGGVEKTAGTELYLSLDQLGLAPPTMNVVLRTTLQPAVLGGVFEQAVRNVDSAVPIVRLRDMEGVFAESIRRPRILASLLGAFAGLALLLAAVGTYGVLSYMVAERRREIGIRLALGAGRATVFALVMRHGLRLTMMGIVIGVAGSFSLNELIAALLFGVQPTDSTTVGAVVAAITLVAALACWVPAWRSSRLDPNVLLKHE